jgi:predicted Zn-ribbon and HTH transcriptional regulator
MASQEKIFLECSECGSQFKETYDKFGLPKCPVCGSYDVEEVAFVRPPKVKVRETIKKK